MLDSSISEYEVVFIKKRFNPNVKLFNVSLNLVEHQCRYRILSEKKKDSIIMNFIRFVELFFFQYS